MPGYKLHVARTGSLISLLLKPHPFLILPGHGLPEKVFALACAAAEDTHSTATDTNRRIAMLEFMMTSGEW